jgi:hypothetical protein
MLRAVAVTGVLLAAVLAAGCTNVTGAQPTPTAEPSPTPIPQAELPLPRCQNLRPPRATPGTAGRTQTAQDTPYQDCIWTETLTQISVPETWEPERSRAAQADFAQLTYLPQNDEGLRRVSFISFGIPQNLRGQDITLRADAIFPNLFGTRPSDARPRQGRLPVSIATGRVDGLEGGIEGEAIGIALGFTDGYQAFILSGITRPNDARRVEDLLFRVADSLTPQYSRQ